MTVLPNLSPEDNQPYAASSLDAKASSAARMECGVCWYVYDPAKGDDVWQIEPGVAFSDLPDHWRCPECDAERAKFLPLDGEENGEDMDDIERIVAAYKRVDVERMQDLPFRNTALSVEAVGFCNWDGKRLGVIISPWFINLVLVPGPETDWSAHKHGDLVSHALPSGHYDFVHGDLDHFGLLQTCSLMSPVGEVEDQATARAIAEEVMRLMLADGAAQDDAGAPLKSAAVETPDPAKPKAKGPISRRELLRGRRDDSNT